MDTYHWFFAGLFLGTTCFALFFLVMENHRKSVGIAALKSDLQKLEEQLSIANKTNSSLRILDTENAKLKYQSEAANQVAKVVLDSQLQREQDLAHQFEAERQARLRAETALQDELARHSVVALELEKDINLIKEVLAGGERYNRPLYRGKLVPLDKADILETDVLPRLESRVFRLKG